MIIFWHEVIYNKNFDLFFSKYPKVFIPKKVKEVTPAEIAEKFGVDEVKIIDNK